MSRAKSIGLLFFAGVAGFFNMRPATSCFGVDLSSLLQNNPFGGAPKAVSQPAPAAPALELRGIMTEGKMQLFSLYDPASKTSAWVGLGETGQPFVVKRYDAPRESVLVAYQGREMTVVLPDQPAPAPDGSGLIAHSYYQTGRSVIPESFVKSETKRLAAVTAAIRRMQAEHRLEERR